MGRQPAIPNWVFGPGMAGFIISLQKKIGDHYAFAAHYEADYKLWNLKSEAMIVAHNPVNAPGNSEEVITMAAYGAPYEVAADFNLYTLAVARDFPVNWGPVSNLAVLQ